MKAPSAILVVLATCASIAIACAPAIRSTLSRPPAPSLMAEFWNAPNDLPRRDLVNGVGGGEGAPAPGAVYKLIKRRSSGFSPKVEVVDPSGKKWHVKMGDEAQPEVVSSRIVWAMGYHQPDNYYLPVWTMEENGKRIDMPPARFLAKSRKVKREGAWSWHHNPFVDTQAFRGLIVLMMVLNSTDLKDDNNAVYDLVRPEEHARRWYVVKDLGATLGATGVQSPKRGDPAAFEQHGFIDGQRGDRVLFDFAGRHRELLAVVHPEDVRWMCARLDRLASEQWRDAFHAGGYDDEQTRRFVRKIRQKIDQGKALAQGGA